MPQIKKFLCYSYFATLHLSWFSFLAICSLFLLVGVIFCNEDVTWFVFSLRSVLVEPYPMKMVGVCSSCLVFEVLLQNSSQYLDFCVDENCRLAVFSFASRQYIGWARWNGDNTSKNELIFRLILVWAVLKRILKICDLKLLKFIRCHFTTDITFFRPYADIKNNGSERKICINVASV